MLTLVELDGCGDHRGTAHVDHRVVWFVALVAMIVYRQTWCTFGFYVQGYIVTLRPAYRHHIIIAGCSWYRIQDVRIVHLLSATKSCMILSLNSPL